MVHTNTFENGMTSDVSKPLQPQGTYPFMKNCSLVSQDGNNYVVKDCLGNLVTFTLNAPYGVSTAVLGNLPTLLALISFPDELISFITNNNDDTGGYGEIGRIDYLPYGEGVQPIIITGQYNSGYTPLYHHASLKFSQLHRIKGISFIENELIKRVYWTDNFNEPRVFNVSDPVFTNYIASGSIVQGNTYMILEGAVEYPVGSFNFYGPGLPNGNIFVGSIPNTTYTDLTTPTPTAKVIDYYPYELLNFVPDRLLGNITFDKYGSGSLICGSKIYYYRLGTNDNILTSWSYPSAPVPVGKTNETAAISGVAYHDFVGAGTDVVTENSGLSVFLNFENIDTKFNFIEVACSEFDNLSTAPRQTIKVFRGNITGSTMNIQHTGNVNLGDVTNSEITLFPASILKCKTLATNKNYIIAGNISEREELTVDLSAATVSVLYYPMPTHMDAGDCTISGMIYTGVSPLNGGYNVSVPTPAGSIYPNSRWKVTSGAASVNTVTYNGTLYLTGDVITGVTGAGNDQMAFAGTGAVVPCVTKNRYTTVASKRVENSIELRGTNPANTCFWDYKSAAVHHHVAGYWGGETYRYAVIFFDLKGNPYYAKHLKDFTFPTSSQQGIIRADQIGNTGDYVYSLNPKLVSFSNIIIPASVINQIRGFSIMRAERDGKVITQGLVMQCSNSGGSSVRPSGLIPNKYDVNGPEGSTYSYLSPDILCQTTLPGNVGVVGDTMEISSWLDAYDYSAGAGAAGVRRARGIASNADGIYSKLLVNTAAASLPQPKKITYWGDISENGTLDLGGGKTFSQTMGIGNSSSIDGTCGSGDYTLDGHEATGCKKSVFKLLGDFFYVAGTGSGAAYSAASGGNVEENTTRILANYTKTGFSNPYGGTGPDALASTVYISTGHYQPITQQVKTDTFDGVDSYIFNNVEIAGGDCYTCLVDIGYGLWDNTHTDKYSYALTFPCECNSNYNLRRGRKTSNSEMYYTGSAGPNSIVLLGPGSEIRLEDFSYNKGYSAQGQNIVYPALPVNFINSGSFQARLRWAGQKFIGETEDSFRKFKIGDKRDISANYGRINAVNVKDDHVFVWQDNAINTVPVLERTVLSGADGAVSTIGTGGVIDRWDVISSFFGTQHQWSITETEYGFAFFDMKRKAFVIIDGTTLEISQVTGNKGILDEKFVEIEGNVITNSALILNSPTFEDSSDRPLTGVGIISVYDPKFKMTYMTFKFFGQDSAAGFKSKDFTIGYLHTLTKKCFVGFYDWFPSFLHNHNQIVLSVNNPKNTNQYLPADLTNKVFAIGDTLWGGSAIRQKEYICIAPVTLNGVSKYPEGVLGTSFWKLISTINQVSVLNQPSLLGQTTAPDYKYSFFDGRVVSNEIWIVVNPKVPNSFEVLNIEQEGSTINFADIYTSGDRQSASDLNIKPWNRFYKIIYDKIASCLPLSPTGRIVDSYLLIKFVKKNWDTDPTVSTLGVKILRWVNSYYEQKR